MNKQVLFCPSDKEHKEFKVMVDGYMTLDEMDNNNGFEIENEMETLCAICNEVATREDE